MLPDWQHSGLQTKCCWNIYTVGVVYVDSLITVCCRDTVLGNSLLVITPVSLPHVSSVTLFGDVALLM